MIEAKCQDVREREVALHNNRVLFAVKVVILLRELGREQTPKDAVTGESLTLPCYFTKFTIVTPKPPSPSPPRR